MEVSMGIVRFDRQNARFWIVLFCLLLLSSSWVPAAQAQAPLVATPLTLLWSDEFSGSSLDPANWVNDAGGGGWGHDQRQYYTNGQNVTVSGGELTIAARKGSGGHDCWYGPCEYTSARIHTKGKHEFKYGRIEARMKLPLGKGLWPAFWMLGTSYPGTSAVKSGEIEIMEHKSTDDFVYGDLHWYDNANSQRSDYSCPPDGGPFPHFDVTQYHVYDIEWDQNYIRWHVDGALFCEVIIRNNTGSTEEFQKPFFILLDLAVGGDFPGSPNSSTVFPSNMVLDYVRAYALPQISGNVGAPGVTLSYTDTIPLTAISQVDGSYSIPVSNHWSGTVIPSHPCYTFNPTSLTYSNLMTNMTGENYASTFNNSPLCAVTTGVFRPSNGALYLKNSNTTGIADIQINYGLAGDTPVVGDWDGDGDATIGIYRAGIFYLRNSNTIGVADLTFAFGSPGDQPIAGDWNGDGSDTIGVYRSSTGTFYLRNSNTTGAPDISFSLGVSGDVGIAGDWNGDGNDTTGVFRPTNGALYLKNTNATGFADIQINYGLAGDRPVTGDWNNDGTDTIGVYRNGSFYLRNSNTIGFADLVFALGVPGDMPISGNWDGKP
jgi:beta-glucanase (GH16 family)